MMLADEKQGFSRRLRESLRKACPGLVSPTDIAREFNLRYHGNPVTAQAVRKWLAGKSLPPQDKIRTLALWLDVQPPWLRFGETERRHGHVSARQEAAIYKVDTASLAKKFELLNEPHKKMVLELVLALLRLEGKQ